MSQAAVRSPLDVETIRGDFPILHKPLPSGQRLVYLDTAATAQKPQAVIDKLVEFYTTYNANAHRGVYAMADRATNELEDARAKVQQLIGAAVPEEIVFTPGTTGSINLVARAWGEKFVKADDEIVVNEMEHHANLVPWQMLAKRTGAKLRYVPLTGDGRLDMQQFDSVLTDRTRMVAVTEMSNVLGTINPIAEIAAKAKAAGALVLVDAAQSVPHQPVNVRDPDIDFLVFSGHKLYGPTGVGVLYGRRDLLEEMDPFLGGGHMIRDVYKESFEPADLPDKFEAGTLPIAQAIGLGAAIDYINGLGFEAIAAHEHQLLDYAHEKLGEVPGLTIHGPAPEHKGAIVSFTVEHVHPHDLSELLDRKGVAIRAGHHCTMPLHEWLQVSSTARASFAFYNTIAEIDALVDAIHYARKVFRLE